MKVERQKLHLLDDKSLYFSKFVLHDGRPKPSETNELNMYIDMYEHIKTIS